MLQYKRKVGELEEENVKMRDQVGIMSISKRQCTTNCYVCLFSALSLSQLCLLVALCLRLQVFLTSITECTAFFFQLCHLLLICFITNSVPACFHFCFSNYFKNIFKLRCCHPCTSPLFEQLFLVVIRVDGIASVLKY